MERVWVFDLLAISVARIDFVDPEVADQPDARERGVRIEVRPVGSVTDGSIYASPTTTLHPAVCRIDLLESRPGAADRMHWHPTMEDGEPGDRTFDVDLPADPAGWLTGFLHRGLGDLLARAGVTDVESMAQDLTAIRETADEIGTAAGEGLAWARTPWPDVERDARGMAAAP